MFEQVLFWFTVVMVHEAGHVLVYLITERKLPVMKVNWMGIFIEDNQFYDTKPLALYFIAIGGIIGGLVVFCFPQTYAIFDNRYYYSTMLVTYILMCGIDLLTISQIGKIAKHRTFLDFLISDGETSLKRYKKAKNKRIETYV